MISFVKKRKNRKEKISLDFLLDFAMLPYRLEIGLRQERNVLWKIFYKGERKMAEEKKKGEINLLDMADEIKKLALSAQEARNIVLKSTVTILERLKEQLNCENGSWIEIEKALDELSWEIQRIEKVVKVLDSLISFGNFET